MSNSKDKKPANGVEGRDGQSPKSDVYVLAMDAARDGILDWNLKAGDIFCSARLQEILGLEPVSQTGPANTWLDRVHPADREAYHSRLQRLSRQDDPYSESEYRVRHTDGTHRWIQERLKITRDDRNTALRLTASMRDITASREAEERLKFLAYYDPLTGLANRTLLDDRAAQAIAAARRTRRGGTLMLIEIGDFGDLIASVGVTAGDAVLVEIAQRLKPLLRQSDTVFRCGNATFGILVTDLANKDDVVSAIHRVLTAFDAPFAIGEMQIHLKASIGTACYPTDGADPQTLFRNATTALAGVTPSDPVRYRFYQKAMTIAATRRLTLQEHLRQAIENDDLKVYYEPQVDAQNPRIVGVEALVRWDHPDHGALPPSEFIPLAERSGLIALIGEIVLRKACHQLRLWKDQYGVSFPVAVNLSREQFRGGRFAKTVCAIIGETGLLPHDLVLELTESAILHDVPAIAKLMAELTSEGVAFAIDDFGVEHSALSQLVHLPVQTIKIDRSFVAQMTENTRFAGLVQAIVSMSKVLNKRTIAEGVETQDQHVFLRAYGCDAVQGYLFSKAVPAEKFGRLIERYKI